MGIKGIKALIKKHAPESFSEIKLESLQGKTVCIDSSILLYKFQYLYAGDNFHILGFLHKLIELDGINCIFVFDGKPPEAKLEVLKKRKEQNEKRKEQLNLLKNQIKEPLNFEDSAFIDSDSEEPSDPEIIKKIQFLEKNIKTVNRQHSVEVMELLESLGIPFFACEGEAEQYCVYLQKNKIADYILTEDTDTLAFGGTNVLFSKGKAEKGSFVKGNVFIKCDLDKVLQGLELNLNEFIDLCILCGCDYTCTIPKVGPISAFNGIKKYKFIENLLLTGKYKVPESFDYQTARNLFKREQLNLNLNKSAKNKSKFIEIITRWNLYSTFASKFKFCDFLI